MGLKGDLKKMDSGTEAFIQPSGKPCRGAEEALMKLTRGVDEKQALGDS